MALHAGTAVGSYVIEAFIGAGGMGEVYRARDTRLERQVALKVLPPDSLADQAARARLIREARLAASLNHPSICTVYDVGETSGLVYVAMELLEGRPLADLIPPDGLALDDVLKYATPIADGLAVAHDRGIVHRDLKSANVVVLPDGRVKILDFGLAARQPRELDARLHTMTATGLDPVGTVSGTLAYMSPEALRGDAADIRSDVWSFGVLLQEMMSGRRPFTGATAADVTSSILRDPPARLPAHVPAGLSAIVQRCLSKEPARRYARAGEIRAALESVRSDGPVSSRRRPLAIRRWALPIGAAVLVLAAGFAILSRFWSVKPPAGNASIRSLAVLPLENLSGDSTQEYFVEGLTEELISRLSRVPGLTVTSRTAVMAFKRSQRPLTEIVGQLGVQALVEGTIIQAGEQVRVTVRLVDAASGAALWSERYDRALADVLAIQAEVAAAIGDAIRSSLTPQERTRLTTVPSTNQQAYDLYLRGRFHQGRENADDNRQAISYFEQSVTADPQFAAAYAELARAYSKQLFYGTPDDSSLQEKAFVAVERALAIDPNLDVAHLARGLGLWQPSSHFPHDRAILSYRRAIQLNPSADEAYHQLGLVYLHIGLLEDARAAFREALRLNPANALARFREGAVFLYEARYAQAAEIFSRTEDLLQPPLKTFQLADSQFHLGRKAEAAETVSAYLRTNPQDPGGLSSSIQALLAADAGDASALDAAVRRAQDRGKGYGHFHHTAFTIARAYAISGRATEAVGWLQRAANDGYPCYPAFANDATLDRIRADARFQAFMAAQQAQWQEFKKLAR